jgi:hypothetical protein
LIDSFCGFQSGRGARMQVVTCLFQEVLLRRCRYAVNVDHF